MINNQNRSTRTEIERSYLADTSGVFTKLAIVAVQYRFPYKCMVTQVVAATTGQIVDQKTPNPCAIPNVDSNAGKVSAGRFAI